MRLLLRLEALCSEWRALFFCTKTQGIRSAKYISAAGMNLWGINESVRESMNFWENLGAHSSLHSEIRELRMIAIFQSWVRGGFIANW